MTILKNLKEATQAIHNSIEAQNLAHKIVDHTITIQDYIKHLTSQFNAYVTVETALLKYCVNNPNSILCALINKEKSELLKKDLKFLNVTIGSIPSPFEIKDFASAIGSLYVIEGSMLGNMMISKHIKKCSDLESIDEFHFYGPSKPKAIERWSAFKTLMNDLELSEDEIRQSVGQAKATFQLF